jgi:nucleoid-associated protein YgaU
MGSGSVRYAEDENERVSMIRWGLLAGIIVVFAFIIFLLASRASINNRYREARDTIASMEAAYARYNSLSREAEALEEENEDLQREINSLQSQLAALGTANNVVPDDNNVPPTIGSETTPGDTTPEPPTLPAQHTITRGQTLISIARMHYGPGANHAEDLARAQHIATYNNIPNIDAIQLDQTITIPPLP